jgi:hypothetical protein
MAICGRIASCGFFKRGRKDISLCVISYDEKFRDRGRKLFENVVGISLPYFY